MPGSPLKRQRKLGARADDGRRYRLPIHAARCRSPVDWRHFSAARKIEHLLGMTLDDMDEILSWPIAELDPFRLSVRMQATRNVFMIGMKAILEGKLGRERDRERVLQALSPALRARLQDGAAPET